MLQGIVRYVLVSTIVTRLPDWFAVQYARHTTLTAAYNSIQDKRAQIYDHLSSQGGYRRLRL